MNTTLSAGCPTGVTITPSTGTFQEGDVLKCSAAEGYDVTYTWTGTAGDGGVSVDHSGSTYTIPDEGDFLLTCTATVSELTCSGTASASVDGTAEPTTSGKY